MLNIILTIGLNAWLFVMFKLFDKFKLDTLQCIVCNYIFCVTSGLLTAPDLSGFDGLADKPWLPLGIVLGFIFIATFYSTALSTQFIGVAVASVASKMSMIIPIIFSLFIFSFENSVQFAWYNYLGILLSLLAVVLVNSKGKTTETVDKASKKSNLILLLPVVVFVFSGIIDTSFNYANAVWISSESEKALLPVFIFFIAFCCGVLLILYRRIYQNKPLRISSLLGGLFLGVPNYFSVYFLLKSLSEFDNNGALLYPIFNISTILLATAISILFFSEKLKGINYLGVAISILSILLIAL